MKKALYNKRKQKINENAEAERKLILENAKKKEVDIVSGNPQKKQNLKLAGWIIFE